MCLSRYLPSTSVRLRYTVNGLGGRRVHITVTRGLDETINPEVVTGEGRLHPFPSSLTLFYFVSRKMVLLVGNEGP